MAGRPGASMNSRARSPWRMRRMSISFGVKVCDFAFLVRFTFHLPFSPFCRAYLAPLPCPGQDKNAKTISVAEITFPDVLLGGVIEITAKLTNIAGTCMGMFTTHADPWDRPLGWKDEQDVEILGGNLFQGNEFQPSGIQMYNWDPK